MRNEWLLVGVTLLLGCGGPDENVRQAIVMLRSPGAQRAPVVRMDEPGRVWTCTPESNWDLVTWPELSAVPATIGPTTRPESTTSGPCDTPIDALSPLESRWYAVRWRGGLSDVPVPNGTRLVDDAQVWMFLGVMPAVVKRISAYEPSYTVGGMRVDSPSIAVGFAELVQLRPDVTLEMSVLVQQEDVNLSCTYEALESVGIGVVTAYCGGIDWALPVTVTVDGLIAHYGGAAVPRVEVTHRFAQLAEGAYEFDVLELEPEPVAPRVPTELCGGEYCE